MKVIDLLNKIANGEEVPKKIRYQAGSHKKDLYTYNEYTGDYEREIGLNLFVYLFMKERITGFLNDEVEVEIIEDKPFNEKVEEIYNSHIDYIYNKEDKKIKKIFINGYDEILDTTLANKINEIIDVINKGDN